jgi:hypothetical protein
MSVFGIRREALRLAKEAGFVYARNNRIPVWRAPRAGAWAGTHVLAPYWRSKGVSLLESHEISGTERVALALGPDDNYVHFTDETAFEYTEYEIESFECNHCSRRALNEDGSDVYRRNPRGVRISEAWCASCRDADAFFCEGSDQFVHSDWGCYIHDSETTVAIWYAEDNYYHHEIDGNWYTYPEDEDGDPEESASGLFNYGTNVLSKHSWPENAPKSALLFGVELEIEGNNNTMHERRAIVRALGGSTGAELKDGAYILAQDGSLDNGVEIITVPQTFEAHKAETVVPWKKISAAIRGIAKSGNTKTCGMHVHINRAALTPLQVGKMLVFLNCDSMTRLVERIAQRSTEQWAKRAPKAFADGLPHRVTEFGHYDALGYTGKGTMELRIFRGNTRRDRIMKNLEFTHAMCEFARLESMQDMDKPSKFLAFIGARERTYPNLCKFLDAHCEDNANASQES